MKQLPHRLGLLLGDRYLVVAEQGRFRPLAEEGQCWPTGGEGFGADGIDGFIDAVVEVVDPEFIEIAQHRIGGFRREMEPVALQLPGVIAQVGAPALHLDQHLAGDHRIGVAHAPAGAGPQDRFLEAQAGFAAVVPAPGAHQLFEEGAGLLLLVAAAARHPCGKRMQCLLLRHASPVAILQTSMIRRRRRCGHPLCPFFSVCATTRCCGPLRPGRP